MVKFATQRVLDVHHWNDKLFSFRTTRDAGLRFDSGHFVMLGLEVEGRALMRAYSIASARYEEHLEFLSVKVPDGPLTSRLQHVRAGDDVFISGKPTGTLVLGDLKPGKRLYLLATGTGLAPFLSIVRDPDTYGSFEKVVLCHGVRHVSDLAYASYLTHELPRHAYLGDMVRQQFIYYPSVTREPFRHRGRITDAIADGSLARHTGLPDLDPATDRAMICGSPDMLEDTSALLEGRGFEVSPRTRQQGDYVIERAFVDK